MNNIDYPKFNIGDKVIFREYGIYLVEIIEIIDRRNGNYHFNNERYGNFNFKIKIIKNYDSYYKIGSNLVSCAEYLRLFNDLPEYLKINEKKT